MPKPDAGISERRVAFLPTMPADKYETKKTRIRPRSDGIKVRKYVHGSESVRHRLRYRAESKRDRPGGTVKRLLKSKPWEELGVGRRTDG